jgi:serine phosphatase RsbU (regulator of sigma subunit)
MRGISSRFRLFSFICFLLLTGASGMLRAQANKTTDSIFAIIHAMPDDTAKVRYVNMVYDSILWMYNLPEAYNELKRAVPICKQYNADTLLYSTYSAMAGFCVRANSHEYALQHRKKQLEIAEKWNDSIKIGFIWGGMAMSLSGLGQNDLAIAYYRKSLPFVMRSGNIERVGRYHMFMGWAFTAAGQTDSAIKYLEMGFAERKKAGYVDGMLGTGNSLLGIYLPRHNFDRMREIIETMIYAYDTMNGGNARPGWDLWFGAIHEEQGHLDSALWYYKQYAANAEAAHDVNGKRLAYSHLASLLPKMGRAGEAYYYLKQYDHLNDSIKDWDTKNTMARQREIYDVESKNAEIEQLLQETTLQQMENDEKDKQRLWLVVVLGITTVLVLVAFLAYRQKRKSALQLFQQKQIIEEKNHDITDSIQYAKRIQQAILPSLQQIKNALPDSFVYFAPKDIVSGDFFWFNETANSYFLGVVDCTGHGVPGAMMSMIGYNFLGQIVNEKDIEQPAEVLNELHRKVLLALNKDYNTRDVKDGMDVSLIRIDKKTRKIFYSGAVRPVYIVNEGKLTEIKGDIYSVGGIKDANTQSFSQHEIEAAPGSCIYLFSDGYADQFGGPKGKKFKYKQLREVITANAHLPMEEQGVVLEQTFLRWKGKLEQVDDVCVVGLRIS